jgi:hypothetical protein
MMKVAIDRVVSQDLQPLFVIAGVQVSFIRCRDTFLE